MSAENLEIVKRIFEDWEKGDFSSTDWAHPEIEFSIPGPDPRVYRGLDEMGRAWREWLGAWKDFSVGATEFVDAGDRIVAAQVFTGEGRGSGLPIPETTGATVLTLRDGLVVRFAGHSSLEDALEDAGVSS